MKLLDTLKGIGAARGVEPTPEAPEPPGDTPSGDGTPLIAARHALAAVDAQSRELEAVVTATQQAIEGNARRGEAEQAQVDRRTAQQVHEGGPMPPLDALRACEAADRELRTRLASLLRRREVLAAEHWVADIAVLEAERDAAEVEHAECQRAIGALTAQIAVLDHERQDLIHRASWFSVNRAPGLERRLAELRRLSGAPARSGLSKL